MKTQNQICRHGKTIVAIVCFTVVTMAADAVVAQGSRPNNLFSQYYTQGASSTHAELYPAPHQVPRHVGHTYNTYQPLMPHEHMYAHQRDYYRYYATPESFYCDQCGGGRNQGGYGVNKTTVRWQSGSNSVVPLPGVTLPFQKLQNAWNRRYTVPRPKTGLLHGALGHHGGGHFGGLGGLGHGSGGGCSDGSCGGFDSGDYGDGYGYESGGGSGYGGCESCAAKSSNWNNARQQAVARAAESMNSRNYR